MERRLLLLAELAVLVLTALVAWETGAAMATRFGADFDLEWMEGATLVTGLRARDGLPFYTVPDADYVPFLYPPVYAWTLGALGKVLPLGYGLGRGVSLLGTLVACAALVTGARDAGARWPLALGTAGLFLSCWAEGGTFYDLVRTDMLSLAPLAWALVLGARPGRCAGLASGLLLALAFATKHHAAMFGVPLVAARWRREGWREALVFGLAAALPALAFTVAMQVATDGLFLRFLLEVPAHHGIVAARALPSVGKVALLDVGAHGDLSWNLGRIVTAVARGEELGGAQAELWRALPITTTLALLLLGRARERVAWIGAFVTALIVAALMRGHVGGYLNVLIPCLWVQSLLPGLLGATPAGPEGSTPSRGARWLPIGATLAVASQLWQGRDALTRYVPTDADRVAHARLVEEVRALPGDVLSAHAPWLLVQAGKDPSLALIALWDIDHEGGPFHADAARVPAAMASQRWSAILTPDDKLGYGLRDHYDRAPLAVTGPPTRTGWPIRLRLLWAPKAETAAVPMSP